MKRILYIIYFLIAVVILAVVVLLIGSEYLSKINSNLNIQNAEKNNEAPQRIVSLAPSITEILFALGLDDRIIAVSSDSDYPPGAQQLKKVGTFWGPDTEGIIATRPDLVVALDNPQQNETAKTLKRLHYNVLSLKIETVEQLYSSIKQIGSAADCQNRSDALIDEIKSDFTRLNLKYGNLPKVKVLLVIQVNPFRVAGRSCYLNEILGLIGAENAIAPTIQQYPSIDTEQLLLAAPEVIIQLTMSKGELTAQQESAIELWKKYPDLPAVKNGRIYVIRPDDITRLGPRLPGAFASVAVLLHPNLKSGLKGTVN